MTGGGAFTVNGATTLLSDSSITSGNGTVTLGTLDGAQALTVNAGTGAVSLGDAGATTALTELTITGNSIALNDVTTSGAQTYSGAVSFASDYVTGGGAFTVSGATILLSDSSISSGNGAVTLGAVDGAQSLVINAGTGAVSLGDAGANTALTGLTITGSDSNVVAPLTVKAPPPVT